VNTSLKTLEKLTGSHIGEKLIAQSIIIGLSKGQVRWRSVSPELRFDFGNLAVAD
jgi:hypothetical protein